MPNITVYITKKNSQHLNEEENKGGLINRLLEEHYSEHEYTKQPSVKSLEEIVKETTFHCCANGESLDCGHWRFVVEQDKYINTKTGETREY